MLIKWALVLCDFSWPFPQGCKTAAAAPGVASELKAKRKEEGRRPAVPLAFFFFKSGKQKLPWKASSRFLLRSGWLTVTQTPLPARGAEKARGRQQRYRRWETGHPTALPHPLFTPPPTLHSHPLYLSRWNEWQALLYSCRYVATSLSSAFFTSPTVSGTLAILKHNVACFL